MTSTTLLADFIVVVHLAYMVVVVFGQFAIMVGHHLDWQWTRNPWFRIIHLTMILIVAYEALNEIECPLTTWERELRVQAGQIPENYYELDHWEVENASFIARLVRGVLMCDRSLANVLTACYYFFAGIVVATLILSPPRFRRKHAPAPPSLPSADAGVKSQA